MTSRVLITGLSSFTGLYLADLIIAAGFEIIDPGTLAQGFDLTSPEAVEAAVAHAAPDYVIHLAAISFVGHGDAADLYRVNTVGTMNLLNALARTAGTVRKVIIASSANVYGNAQVSPIDEATAPAPVNHYACSKISMEFLARGWFDRLPIVITRPFNYTGVGQRTAFLVPKIVDHFRRRADVIELGNLDVERDFSDVRDVAAAYVALLTAPARGEIVNICSGRSYSLQWIIDQCTTISGHPIRVERNPAFMRADEIKVLCGSPALLDRLTGGEARRDFSTTLRWMLDAN